MEKQDVLEKVIFYITKQKPELFYEKKKGKYFINISEIENYINKQTRLTFSNDEEDFEGSIFNIIDNYSNKQMKYQELKNELERIMYNESNKLDKKLSEHALIQDKRREIDNYVSNTLAVLNKELGKINMIIEDLNLELYLSNYVLFVLKANKGVSPITDVRLSENNSYIDFMCRETVLEHTVKEHYKHAKLKLDKTMNKNVKEYYEELKIMFQSITKEELYIPIEKLWQIKLSLDILFYVPVKENKLISFYYIINKTKTKKVLKIDPYMYNTINTFIEIFTEESVREFKTFYHHVFGDNNYRKDFLSVLKNKGAWNVIRNVFINICMMSNSYIFGEFIRNITKEKKIYEEVSLENSYHSYIDKDMISQKIASGIETPKDMETSIDKYIVCCSTFDRREELTEEFIEKMSSVLSMLFDNYPPIKDNFQEDDDDNKDSKDSKDNKRERKDSYTEKPKKKK